MERPNWSRWRPGQFVMVRHPSFGQELTWGRAISISRMTDAGLTLFIQLAGRGTRRLADTRPGESLTVWGPLGNGFAVQEKPTLMLAGGVGLAPFLAYAEKHPNPQSLELFFGHRLPIATYPFEDLANLAPAMTRRHFHEQTPEDLPRFIAQLRELMTRYKDGLVLACGPTPFLRTVRELALELGTMTQLSLENKMGCGVGACLGCVVQDEHDEPVQVCSRGPIFWAHKITL